MTGQRMNADMTAATGERGSEGEEPVQFSKREDKKHLIYTFTRDLRT